MMWSSQGEELANGRILQIAVAHASSPMSYAAVFHSWQHDADFRSFFMSLLADNPFSAFRWETPPVTAVTVDRPFEFVLIDSPGLASHPDPKAFADYFTATTSTASVVSFSNLGNDAVLVVPCPRGPLSAYGHLAAFVRHAPEVQRCMGSRGQGDGTATRQSSCLAQHRRCRRLLAACPLGRPAQVLRLCPVSRIRLNAIYNTSAR
jgi:hypothetical protein